MERVAISFSRESLIHIPCVSWVEGRFFTNTATWEDPDNVIDQ